jgi:TPR repeat protein
MRKPLLLILICSIALAGCVTVQSSDDLKTIFDSGVAAYDAGDYPKAYKIWSGIEDQDLAAMRNVALMLRTGNGVAKNPRRAEELFETASQAGLPTAQADLADMLLKGEAGPPDPARALPLLEAAAAADHPIAEYELAQMFETGGSGLVPKDLSTARKLYAAAAMHGMQEAKVRLDAMGPALPGSGAPPASGVQPTQPAPPPVRLMQPAPASPPSDSPGGTAPIRPAQP